MTQFAVTLFMFIGGALLTIKIVNIIGQILIDLFEALVHISGTIIVVGGSIWFLMNIMP